MGGNALGLLSRLNLFVEIFHAGDEGVVGVGDFLVCFFENGELFFQGPAIFFKFKPVAELIIESLFD